MRIDRVVDWDYVGMYNVKDWIDFGNNVGMLIETDCLYKGDHNDWPNGDQDYSLLVPMKDNEPEFNVFAKYEEFEQERANWMEEPAYATTIENVKKSDPIFKYGFYRHKRNIIEHLFEIGGIS
jgi:hypothetical protein